LFQRNEFGFGTSGGTVALSLDQAITPPIDRTTLRGRFRHSVGRLSDIDWVPDLGADIGSRQWFRGVATCMLLCGATLMMSPGFRPLIAPAPAPLEGRVWDETQAQTIAPLAMGADTGRRMAATDLVEPLNDTPERPSIELSATLGQGDGFARVLERAGVSDTEARQVAGMVSGVTNLTDIAPGTVIPITLGERTSRGVARPIQSLTVRARFDMRVAFTRVGGRLQMQSIPIAVDHTPLRIQGRVGESLYRAARAAGVPAKAVETYIRAISSKLSLDRYATPNARFDVVVEHARAETGETIAGKLLYAGLESGGRATRLLPWTIAGRTEWYEASGVGEKRAGMTLPVSGARISSGFGMRFHPILGYSRFHRGMDYAAVYGTPVHAVSDGIVAFAGRHGGNGNFIRLNHSANMGTSYSHLSRIMVAPGGRVAQGQVIGYVGSTGLSTGPHLHFEVYRGGEAINPAGVSFASTSLLSGRELDAFRARLRAMLTIPIAGSGAPVSL
jgi:murein DD-endopeptidase MepM/ murein hydrolase activator NlpD